MGIKRSPFFIYIYFEIQSTLIIMTDKAKEQLEHLSEIRNLMAESTQFLSLSGLSGVFSGIYALVGAYLVRTDFFEILNPRFVELNNQNPLEYAKGLMWERIMFLLGVAAGVLLLSLLTGYLLTAQKAKKQGKNMFGKTAIKMVVNLFIPLMAGGIFCLALIKQGYIGAVAPATLIFYGVALINASKYTYRDIRYLGLCEIGLGLISAFFMGYGLWFWALGFGVLHIIYGLTMYMKYDRKA